MRRRELLVGAAGVGGGIGVGGCLQSDDDGDDGATDDGATTGTAATTAAPSLAAQVETVRGLTEQYDGPAGVERAFDDGFRPLGPTGLGWRLVRDPVRRTDLSLRTFTSLAYLREGDGDDGALSLAGVAYSVAREDHRTGEAHGPPDLFADDPQRLATSEREAWERFHDHPLGAIRSAFSNGDREVDEDVTALPDDELFDADNWTPFVDRETWTERGGLEPGDRFDVDGDGTAEILDYVLERRTAWDLTAWVHVREPDRVFEPPEG